jgi:hypothetical protein
MMMYQELKRRKTIEITKKKKTIVSISIINVYSNNNATKINKALNHVYKTKN